MVDDLGSKRSSNVMGFSSIAMCSERIARRTPNPTPSNGLLVLVLVLLQVIVFFHSRLHVFVHYESMGEAS